uniref:Ig-like domain-containing protein n=1 Tax=Neogobius melanostomus TaxID=47308 RepID=A0A8C6SWZ9_9GOBI
MSLLTVSLCWLLVGYCALLDLSASAAQALQITQKPRFYGVMTNRKVGIHCMSSKQNLQSNVTWYKASKFDSEKSLIRPGDRFSVRKRDRMENDIIILKDLKIEDQGVYFCKINNDYGPGTEVQVTRPVNEAKVLYRSKMKDALMILQGLLLALIIAAFGFRKKTLVTGTSDKEESIYEEPEVDHIYEGLAIETCDDGDLYEEISVYAQAEGAEAPWE